MQTSLFGSVSRRRGWVPFSSKQPYLSPDYMLTGSMESVLAVGVVWQKQFQTVAKF